MNFREFLKNNIVILDGGFGTELAKRLPGETFGKLPETFNLTHPDVVTSIHRDYYDAGSNVVFTNTFGANVYKFSEEELDKIVRAAVNIANKARCESTSNKEKFIALDIGPLGKLLKPCGTLSMEEAISVFKKTIKSGYESNVDLVFIETMTDSLETKAAVIAAKEVAPDLPLVCSNAFSENGRLLTGTTPEAMAIMLESLSVDACGVNCSLGPNTLLPIVEKYINNINIPVVFKPNAGLPKIVNGETTFDLTPSEFASFCAEAVDNGVRLVGGCCGTTPSHIKLLSEKLVGKSPVIPEKKNGVYLSSATKVVDFENRPLVVGERINPTGKKKLKEALRTGNFDYILGEAEGQTEKGADVLDVNVGLPELNEEELLPDVVEKIQMVSELPIEIDTSNPKALEKALRRVNGKALINSVNGTKESMDAVFPLAKKYGGVVVCLTLDENGIPATSEGRIGIATKIVKEAEKYGISKDNLVFDALCLSVATDVNAAKTTLEAVSKLTRDLQVKTILGVSNVSFGLPMRDTVNATFLTMALTEGLTSAIINPFSNEMMGAVNAFRALNGKDPSCEGYISFAGSIASAQTKEEEKKEELSTEEKLKKAIIKGHKDAARDCTITLLEKLSALSIINDILVPALDEVGVLYEQNKLYLPELLSSANAASNAFTVIKENSAVVDGTSKGKFVIATVKGDIHDIGKNIVKMLLENYGFDVIDLGRDVPKEDVLRVLKESGAKLLGLSALMTTTVPSMEETIKLVKSELPDVRICVGGAVLNEDIAMKIGADKYAKDAMETVRYAMETTPMA